MKTKKIDLGEYVITISYDKLNNHLEVIVYDEGGDAIEAINIEDDDNEEDTGVDFNLN